MKFKRIKVFSVCCLITLGLPCLSITIHPEVEPNNTVSTAQHIANFQPGDRIEGSLFNHETDRDYFRVSIGQQPFAIYRSIVGAGGRDGSPRSLYHAGLVQYQNNVPIGFYDRSDEDTFYRSMFYHFGRPLDLNVGIISLPSSQFWLRDWGMGIRYEVVTPTDLGQFQAGEFRFRDGDNFMDTTAIAIYDSQGNLVPGSYQLNLMDDPFDHTLTLAPGRYFMPIFSTGLARQHASGQNIHHNLPIIMAGNVGDFSGQLRINTLTRSETINWDMANQPDEMLWYGFEVVPEPATLITLGAGAAVVGLRRRYRR